MGILMIAGLFSAENCSFCQPGTYTNTSGDKTTKQNEEHILTIPTLAVVMASDRC
jgi:hypothetical protein